MNRLVLALLALLAMPAALAQDFPRTITHAFGTTAIAAPPKRIVALTDIDFDIALGLGLFPVLSANAGYDAETAPYHQPYLDAWQGEPVQFFSPYAGAPFETILAADPDVILATGYWALDSDYERLSAIAPVVAYQNQGDAVATWQDKTRTVGAALGLEDKAEALIARVEARFAEVAAANPQFAGKTVTYGVVHPEQFSYMSVPGDASTMFFKLLGFSLPATAAQFTPEASAVSRERLDLFDADVLLLAFPFEGEAFVTQKELEADPLFRRIPAVAAGHYIVVPPDVASTLAYPSPLSTLWTLERMQAALEAATT